MAVETYMDYEKMDVLLDFLTGKKKEIDNKLDFLTNNIPPQITANYNGQASEVYKSSVVGEANKVRDAIDELITKLKTNIEENKAGYKKQDANAAGSVEPASNTDMVQ